MWLYKTARDHFWRVQRWYDLNDLIQDGFIHYWRVTRKYPEAERPQIMSLFKVTYINHIHDLAKNRSKIDECLVLDQPGSREEGMALSEADAFDTIRNDEGSEAETAVLIANAPAAVKAVLTVLASQSGRRKVRSPYRFLRGTPSFARETNNQKWSRLTGLPEGTDFEGIFRDYFAAV
jgi:hypothetical protein